MNREGAKDAKRGREGDENPAGEMLAWHFLPKDGRLGKPLEDGSRPIITPGWTYRADDPMEMRHRRLHGWKQVIDALTYARGMTVCRVCLRGSVVSERDGPFPQRLVTMCYANEFTVLWAADARRILYHFICDLAEEAMETLRDRGWVPDSRLWDVVAAKRLWIEAAHQPRKSSPMASRDVRETIRIPNYPTLERYCWLIVDAVSLPWHFEPPYGMTRFVSRTILVAAGISSVQRVNAELERRLTEAFGDTGSA